MAEHESGMENLSVLVLDDDMTSLLFISKMLEKLSFKVYPFQTEQEALDFLKKRAAKEEELDLILTEVHVSNMASHTLANSELLNYIMSELHVPFVSMCCNDDEEAISECMAIGACFHLPKPLTTGSFNMLRHTATQHKARRATPEGTNTFCRTVSSSTKMPKEMFKETLNLQREIVCQRESEKHEEPDVHLHSNKPNRLRSNTHGNSKKPDKLIWTVDLHAKFLEAIEVLGDKYAVPNRILKQMKVKNLTVKHMSSHLQKHRLRLHNAQQGQFQQSASKKPVLEQIRSAHNASITESITPRVAADFREMYPSMLWKNVKEMSAEAVALKAYSSKRAPGIFSDDTKSVWDNYYKSLQNDPCWSSRRREYEQSAKSKDVARDEGIPREGPKTAGEIGYGAPFESSGSNSLLTSSLSQTEKNNLTETAGNNDNVGDTAMMYPSDGWLHLQGNDALLDDTNKSFSAQMYLTGPADDLEEINSFWMSHMNGPQEQLNFSPEDMLQVDEAWNEALVWGTQPSLVNVGEPITQEAAVGDAPVRDPMMQLSQTQETAVGDAPVPDPVMQFAQTQEAAVGDAPVLDHVMQFVQDDTYWSLSPLVGDYDMLL